MVRFFGQYLALIFLANVAAGVVYSAPAFSQSGPTEFSLSGGLYYPNGTPITQKSVDFKIEILDASNTCVLYQELHNDEDLSTTRGGFALQVGTGTSGVNNVTGGSALTSSVFENNGATSVTGCGSVNLASGDNRLIRVSYDLGSGFVAMNPTIPMTSSAYAMVAESVQGKRAADLVQIRNDNSTYYLGQSNIEWIFNSTNWPRMQDLLNGTSSQYMVSSPSADVSFNNRKITNLAAPTASTDAATKQYADGTIGGFGASLTGIGLGAGEGSTLVWNAVDNRWEIGSPNATDNSKLPLAGGTMSGAITMGGNDIANVGQIYNVGHITMQNQSLLRLGSYSSAQESLLALGTGNAGTMFYNSDLNQLRVWNGTDYSGIAPGGAAGGDLTGSYPSPTITGDAVTSAKIADGAVTSDDIADDTIASVDIGNNQITSAKLNNSGIAINRLLITDATTGSTVTYANCAQDEILKFNSSTGWGCSTAVSLLGNTGVTAGSYGSATSVGTFSVDGQGRLTSASNLAINFPVTSVAGKTGDVSLNTADVAGLGTAATYNVGTAAGEIPALDSSARIPAIDGGLLTNVNAARLQGRSLSSASPSDGQILVWNNTFAQWEPQSSSVASAFVQGGNSYSSVATLGTNDNFSLEFETNNTTRMSIDTSGNVGIGTTSPSAVLDVTTGGGAAAFKVSSSSITYRAGPGGADNIWDNSGLALGTASGQNYRLYVNGSGRFTDRLYLGSSIDFTTAGGEAAKISSPAWDVPALSNSGGERFRITASGSVGIGTTSPTAGAILDLNGTGAAFSSVIIPRDTTALRPTTGVNGMIRYNTSTQKFEAFEGSWKDMISSAAGGADITDVVAGSGLLGGASSGAATLSVQFPMAATSDGTAAAPAYSFSGDTDNGMFKPSTDSLAFSTAGTQRLTIGSNGNVGIGTTNPAENLDTYGNIRISATTNDYMQMKVSGGTYNSATFTLRSNQLAGQSAFIFYPISYGALGNYKIVDFRDNTNSTQAYVENTGLLAGKTLRTDSGSIINGNNGTLSIINTGFGGSGGGTAFVFDSSNGQGTAFSFRNQGTEIMTIRGFGGNPTDGNVGIGTTSPEAKLHVRTNDMIVGTEINGGDTVGAPRLVLRSSSWGGSAKIDAQDKSGASFGSLSWNMSPALTTLSPKGNFVIPTGNVGIGTTSPTAGTILDLNGTGTSSSSMIIPRDTTVNRPTVGVNGMIRYNTTTQKFEAFEGSWKDMISSAAGGADITDVVAGSGLLGGASSGAATLSVQFPMAATADGTAALPTYAFSSDPDTGMYRSGTNELAFAVQGTQRLRFDANGKSNFFADVSTENGVLYAQDLVLTTAGDFQQQDSNATSYFAGRLTVGANTVTTGARLDVVGTGAAFSSMIVPRDTTGNRPTVGVNGMIRYNTTSQKFEAFEGSWKDMISSAAGGDITDVIAGSGLLGGATSGSATLSVQFPMAATSDGTAAAPAYSFSGDADNGMFKPNTNSLAFSTFGTERLTIGSGGNVGIGTTNPSATLHFVGTELQTRSALDVPKRISGDSGYNRYVRFETALSPRWDIGANSISESGSNSGSHFYINRFNDSGTYVDTPFLISRTTGNIGIGTSSPTAKLHIQDGQLRISSAAGSTILGAVDVTALNPGTGASTNAAQFTSLSQQHLVLDLLNNETQDSIAFRYSAANSGAVDSIGFVMKGNGNVGIGTTSPERKLHVAAPVRFAPSDLPATPGAGDLAIDSSDSNKLKYFNGTSWVTAGVSGAASDFPNIPTRTSSSDTGSSNQVSMPSAIQAGEMLLVVFTAKSGTHGYPSGWTKITETSIYPFVSVAYKVANGSEGGSTITVTTSGSDRTSHQAFRIRDYQGVPEVVSTTGTSTTPDSPSLSPSWGSANTLWLAVSAFHLNVNTLSSYPAGYSNGIMVDVAGQDPKTAVAQRQTSAASENPGAFTIASSTTWTAATIAIRAGSNGASTTSDNLGNHTATQNLKLGNFWLSSDGDSEGVRIDTSGNVGIGTASPAEKLHVTGNMRATGQLVTGSQTITSGTTAIDWNNGNIIATDYNCASPFTFANLQDGGTYTLVVTNSATTQCNFSTTVTGTGAGTVAYRWRPANGARTTSSTTVYTLMRVGSIVLVSWASGFQ